MFCSKCGTQLNEGSAFCSRCGERVALVVEQVAQDVSPKSRLATTLLAVFLGWAGAHRFYVGKTGTAVVMLLLGAAAWVCYFGYASAFFAATTVSDRAEAPVWLLLWGLSGLFGIAVGIWTLIDFIIAVTGNFKVSQGKIINKW